MDDADRPRFATALGGLLETFAREASAPLIEGYWHALRDLPLEAVHRGIARALRDCRFCPAPVEIRELAGELSAEARALRAWDVVERAVRRVGSYKSIDFDDPITNGTIRSLGGWVRLCGLAPAEFDKWCRKDFLTVYRTLAAGGALPADLSAPLDGIHASRNGRFELSQFGPAAIASCEPVRISTGLPPANHLPSSTAAPAITDR